MRTALLIAIITAAAATATTPPASAQEPDRGTPDRINSSSLVLSGGGARGLAHAGSIVALDSLGYDPSLVVGTSMGAIVGALYAAGYSPAEVWSFVAGENWLERFAAEPVPVGRNRIPLRPVLGFGVGSGRFYEGLLPTTNVNLRLVELLFDAGVRARNDFDRLPRRYRAVAADLGTGEEVVLGAGDLPRAVRASMAVPGAFAPVLWNGRILADGGLANNLPVSVAAAISDAPIIAVDVLQPNVVLDERSSIDLGVRALRLLIANVRPDSVAPDILVLPRIGTGFSETRFPSDASGLLAAGRAAVDEQVPAATPAQTGGTRAAGSPPRAITALRIDADDDAIERLVRRIMEPAVGPYDAALIVRLTAALYGTGLFQAVWPWLEFDSGDDGAATLVVDITPIAGTSTSAAVRWDIDTGGGGWFSLRQRASAVTPVEVRAGVMLSELGRAASVDGSLFSSLAPGVIWNAGLHYGEQRIRVFGADTVLRLDSHRRGGAWAGAELHGPVRDWFVSALGRLEHVRAENGEDGWGFGPYIRLGPPPRVDRVTGVDPLVEWESRLGDVTYSRARFRLGVDRVAAGFRTSVFTDLHGSTRGAPADAQPAATRELVPWLAAGRLRSRTTATVGVDVARRMLFDGYVRLRLRAFGADARRAVTAPGAVGPAAEAPGADGSLDVLRRTDAWHVGGELGAVWPTFVGPVAAGVAVGRGDWRFNLSLGAGF